MPFKDKLAEMTNLNRVALPSGYQIIGDILLLKLSKVKSTAREKEIGEAILKIFPYIKTVCEIKKVSGEFRRPEIKILAGKSTKTIHRENGCIFKIDVSKIMFSKGNHFERKRLIGQIKSGETIVDMFAGIGYFSIPLGKFSKAKKIYSIEKNKKAFGFLKENILLNRIQNIEPIYGDCGKILLPEKVDCVLMGYLPKTYKFLSAAFGFLKDKGIIHYHDTFSKNELWYGPLKILEKEAGKEGFKLENILNKRIVKDYAPNVYHVVIDATFRKINI